MEKVLRHSLTGRLVHWSNAVCILLLSLTGFYIHSPSGFNIFPSMDVARKIHFIAMYILVFATVYRLYFSIATGDYKNLFYRPIKDWKNWKPMLKYYLFMTDSHPEWEKYNPGQRLLYGGWLLIILLIQAPTGFILYWPDAFPTLQAFFGGLMVVRLIHYFVTWFFVVGVMAHFYLDMTEGIDVLKSMITGYMPVKKGHHAHGIPSEPSGVGTKLPKQESI